MSLHNKMRDKIAKLLRQAEDVAGTPEEGVFQAKAFELMAKYGVELASVEAARAGLDVSPDAIEWVARIDGSYKSQQMQLLYGIVRPLHCSAVYESGRHMGIIKMHVYGVPRQIERVQMLWELLRPQMLRLAQTIKPLHGGNTARYRRSWIAGFGSAVESRLTQQEALAVESKGGVLALYRDDSERADAAMRDANPRVKVSRSRTSYDAGAYFHGQRDGNDASLAHSLK